MLLVPGSAQTALEKPCASPDPYPPQKEGDGSGRKERKSGKGGKKMEQGKRKEERVGLK